MIELIVPILMLVFFLAIPLFWAIRSTMKDDEAQLIVDRLRGFDRGTTGGSTGPH